MAVILVVAVQLNDDGAIVGMNAQHSPDGLAFYGEIPVRQCDRWIHCSHCSLLVLIFERCHWERMWDGDRDIGRESREVEMSVCVCMCMHVCEIEREWDSETVRERERVGVRLSWLSHSPRRSWWVRDDEWEILCHRETDRTYYRLKPLSGKQRISLQIT